jgi:hypothetical protein
MSCFLYFSLTLNSLHSGLVKFVTRNSSTLSLFWLLKMKAAMPDKIYPDCIRASAQRKMGGDYEFRSWLRIQVSLHIFANADSP